MENIFNTIKKIAGLNTSSDYDEKDIGLYLDELEATQIEERFHGGINCNVNQSQHGRLYKIKRQTNVSDHCTENYLGNYRYE